MNAGVSVRSRAPVVYLDTQDYSNFANVLLGKGSPALEATFNEICRIAKEGSATFVYSMPILSELLQYDAAFEHTCRAKAEVVERICNGHAIAYPPRVLAHELATYAHQHGLIDTRPGDVLISNDDFWFPDIGDVLQDFAARIEGAAAEEIEKYNFLPRNQRRVLKKGMKPRNRNRLIDQVIPEMAAKYGVPASSFRTSVLAMLQGKIDSREASRRLFGAVQRPSSFLTVYFKQYAGKKDLPTLIRGPGENIKKSIDKLVAHISPIPASINKMFLPKLIEDSKQTFAKAILDMAEDGAEEFHLDQATVATIRSRPDALSEIPACFLMGELVSRYVAQAAGMHGPPAKTERSFAGDVIHALYLPHVDIWRGDARFCELIRQSKIPTKARIVSRLKELPQAICNGAVQVGGI